MPTTDVSNDHLGSNPNESGGTQEGSQGSKEVVCRIEYLLGQISQDLALILEKLP